MPLSNHSTLTSVVKSKPIKLNLISKEKTAAKLNNVYNNNEHLQRATNGKSNANNNKLTILLSTADDGEDNDALLSPKLIAENDASYFNNSRSANGSTSSSSHYSGLFKR